MPTQDKRFSLSGYNLTLHEVEERDAGEYICEVETYSLPIRPVDHVLTLPSFIPSLYMCLSG
jgi:hypothetical protein